MRELRMILRDVTFRLLTNRRWDAFAEPPTPEDDPENWDSVHASPFSRPIPLILADSMVLALVFAFIY